MVIAVSRKEKKRERAAEDTVRSRGEVLLVDLRPSAKQDARAAGAKASATPKQT